MRGKKACRAKTCGGTNSSNSVEFPAVGSRSTYGSLQGAGTYGGYWSSVADGSDNAYRLYFYSSNLYVNYTDKQYGFSVRCVR